MIEMKLGVAAKAAVAVAAMASATAFAQNLPDFTLAPAGAGLTGGNLTADNIIISDYSRVVLGAGGSFTDSGYLAVSGFQLNGADIVAAGLNSTYGLYFQFTATGTQGSPSFATSSFGTFDSLQYTLYGYNGPAATFTPTSTTATGAVALASGSLIPGTGATSLIVTSAGLTPGATLSASVNVQDPEFFVNPNPFYGMAMAVFANTPSQVTLVSPTEFTIFQGGGAVNFAAPIPEPQTYALMLAGLGLVAFIARRRQRS